MFASIQSLKHSVENQSNRLSSKKPRDFWQVQNHVLSVTHFINAAAALHILVQILPLAVGEGGCVMFNYSDIRTTGYRNNIAVKCVYQWHTHHCSLQTNYMKRSPSWEVNSFSASQGNTTVYETQIFTAMYTKDQH